jgi:hypothetical protein
MTAEELQQKMLDHIERVRLYQTTLNAKGDLTLESDRYWTSSVLRHLDGADLLRVDQFVRSFRTE